MDVQWFGDTRVEGMLNVIDNPLIAKLGDSLFESAKEFAKDKLEKKRINDTVKNHFEKWLKTQEMALPNEELDLGGIGLYIDQGFVHEVFDYCAEINQAKRIDKYRALIENLYAFSKADNQTKRYFIKHFLETIIDIVESIACEYVDPNTKIAIARTVDNSKEKLSTVLPDSEASSKNTKSTLINSIKQYKRKIKNQPLISSVPERISFGALFEEEEGKRLYIDSPISMRKSFKKYNGVHNLFKEKKGENLLVTGPAGSGKSTGLKALFLTNDSETEVYYATVKEYRRSRSEMIRTIRETIAGSTPSNETLIILDGLDEEFPNNPADAITFVETILKSNTPVWIGCRENFYSKIAVSLNENFDDIAVMEKWNEPIALLFMTKYADADNNSNLKERINVLKSQLSIIQFIISNPFFLTLFLFAIDWPVEFEIPKNEYDLISLFLDRWFDSEKNRGTTTIEKEAFFHQLYGIANQLYSGIDPTIDSIDEALQGLLIIRRSRVSAFVHWDFCVYLISRQIIEATVEGDLAIVSYYPQAFMDDVTNMTWEYLESLQPVRLKKMYNNLFDVYTQIYEPQKTILSQEACKQIQAMDGMLKLMLKDEIIYFALRLPIIDISAFFEYASEPSRVDHPIIELGLAYGIGMRKSHPFALAFAQKLRPGSPESLLNRSWTVAFFGDQRTLNIYEFEENPVASWDMARAARMKRFRKNTEKAYRYRVFDIPLLYCFYDSRDWTGCISEEELTIIKNCDIDWPYYSKQEKDFLREQKKRLVDDYSLFLEYQKSLA